MQRFLQEKCKKAHSSHVIIMWKGWGKDGGKKRRKKRRKVLDVWIKDQTEKNAFEWARIGKLCTREIIADLSTFPRDTWGHKLQFDHGSWNKSR